MMPQVKVLPEDEYNRILVSNAHPPGWVNPEPASLITSLRSSASDTE